MCFLGKPMTSYLHFKQSGSGDKNVTVANLNKLDYNYEDLAGLIHYSSDKKSEWKLSLGPAGTSF
jgi:hypothetical protein